MIHPSRIQPLNSRSIQDGRYILYWMQASQRVECNHALEHAVGEANERNLPVVVVVGLTDRFPEANLRHYAFMLEGLEEVRKGLEGRGIRFALMHRSPELAATAMADEAALVVADRGYLRIQRQWRNHVAKNAPCAVVQVESDAVVPVETASPKEEYTAGTLRPKLQRILKGYLAPLKERPVRKDSLSLRLDADPEGDFTSLLKKMKIDRTVTPVRAFRGGTARANALLEEFIAKKIRHYDELRNDPGLDYSSHLSPYLHFGQISPLAVALRVSGERTIPAAARESFLEELIVRRELSMNFVFYNDLYDEYECLPDWAKKTLAEHAKDRREALYSRGRVGARRDPRPLLECRPAGDDDHRQDAQLHAHVLGEKDPRVEPEPGRGIPNSPLAEQQVRARRKGPQRVCRRGLVLRQARPGLVREEGLRQDPLHERCGAQAQVRHGHLPEKSGRPGEGPLSFKNTCRHFPPIGV